MVVGEEHVQSNNQPKPFGDGWSPTRFYMVSSGVICWACQAVGFKEGSPTCFFLMGHIQCGWWLGVALFQEAHISWMKNPKTGQSWGFLLILDVDDEEWLGAFWIIEWSRHVRILYCVVLDCRKFVRRTLDYF